MRVMLLHKLAEDILEDYVPPQKLIADVGKMVSDARDAGLLRDGAGLRSTQREAQVRLQPRPGSGGPGTRPYGVYYLYYIHTHGLVSGWDWVLPMILPGRRPSGSNPLHPSRETGVFFGLGLKPRPQAV
jgi:hypothetical protein